MFSTDMTVYTLTLNAAIDYLLQVGGAIKLWQRLGEYDMIASGKGVNTSLLLRNLNVKTVPLVGVGGPMGEAYKAMLARDFKKYAAFDTGADTRVNVKVSSQNKTFELNTTGRKATNKALVAQIAAFVAANVKKSDVLAVMGSLPHGMELDDCEPIFAAAVRKGAKLVVDISGKAVMWSARHRPLLVKPNEIELAEMFNRPMDNLKEIVKAARELLDMGAQTVVVSRGSKGAVCVDREGVLIAKGLKVKVINSAGAGDCMVGGYLAGYATGLNRTERFRLAVASATAKVTQQWMPEAPEVSRIKAEVKIGSE